MSGVLEQTVWSLSSKQLNTNAALVHYDPDVQLEEHYF